MWGLSVGGNWFAKVDVLLSLAIFGLCCRDAMAMHRAGRLVLQLDFGDLELIE